MILRVVQSGLILKDIPHFYALPKVHKAGSRPIRAAHSFMNTPAERVIDTLLNPYMTLWPTIVRGTLNVLQHIEQTKINGYKDKEGDESDNKFWLVVIDFVSLYTNIDTSTAINESIKRSINCKNLGKFKDDPIFTSKDEIQLFTDLMRRCHLCTLFEYKEQCYNQIRGLAMGDPIQSS